ncbi:MAG TPA: GNAT family N-acetyltransferase [Bacteroidia bacterium]|nr:GNAT family N-acetyltransferase [Bacteroidia bacterium]
MDKIEKYNFLPYPELKTNRLILRCLDKTDEEEVFFFRSDPRILEHLDRQPAKELEEARAHIEKILNGIRHGEWIDWCITLAGKPKLVGNICLWNISIEENSAEIGYALHPDYQGKGIMNEAAKAVIEFGFKKMKLKKIVANLSPHNLKSITLLEKNNFQKSPIKKGAETIQYFLENS